MFDDIITYRDFADQLGARILCNQMATRELEQVNGDLNYEDEIFQWYIVSEPSFAIRFTKEPVFYDNELHLYVLGVTHFGTDWDYVSAPEIYE